ncbi:hypothetical protein ACWD4P_21500 [Kitasatospora sp. NPDC002543]
MSATEDQYTVLVLSPLQVMASANGVSSWSTLRQVSLLVDPAQTPRLQAIHANLVDRRQEAEDPGRLGEVAAIETTMAAAAQKLEAMRERAAQPSAVHLGMPDIRRDAGRSSTDSRD